MTPKCPACHHRDHDPGSCEWCPFCELHTDDALAFVLRTQPTLLDPIRVEAVRHDQQRLRRALVQVTDLLERSAAWAEAEDAIAAARALLAEEARS